MSDNCEAEVAVDSFSEDGSVTFKVTVSDCKNSTGRFEYWCEITKSNGDTTRFDRRLDFRVQNDTSTEVTDSLSVAQGSALTGVEVKGSTIECRCLD